MSYQKIRNTKEGFVRGNTGDKLISIESKILAIVTFILMLAFFNTGFITALITSAIVGFVFPWLVGLVEIFAWIALIIFSLVWAVIGYFIIGAIAGSSPVVGAIGAIIAFVISFFTHKVFAGIGYSSVEKYKMNALDDIRNNTSK